MSSFLSALGDEVVEQGAKKLHEVSLAQIVLLFIKVSRLTGKHTQLALASLYTRNPFLVNLL